MAAVERYMGDRVELEGTASGLHALLWIRGLPWRRVERVVERAAVVGVAVDTVNRHALTPQRRAGLLLGYTLLDEDGIREGIRRLASVL